MKGFLLACASALTLAAPASATHYFAITGVLTGSSSAPDLEFSITANFPDYLEGAWAAHFTAFTQDVTIVLGGQVANDMYGWAWLGNAGSWNEYRGFSFGDDYTTIDGITYTYDFRLSYDVLNGTVSGFGLNRWPTGQIYSVEGEIMPYRNPVPEPATWAMMLGGFALVGAAMRRRYSVAFA